MFVQEDHSSFAPPPIENVEGAKTLVDIIKLSTVDW
jgi:hypothetical protein